MILADVNVLVYAHRADAERHAEYRKWLESILEGPGIFGLSELVLSGFLRIVTHPKVFDIPTPLPKALAFAKTLISHPLAMIVRPGVSHWKIFADLCQRTDARGNLIADAYLAALAIEHDCEWITTDRDFTRFTGLKWRHPLASSSHSIS